MSKLPINTTIAMTFNKYFNDARDNDIEKCKDDTIKNARDKITYMAETINDNIKTSTDMVSTSSKLKALIIDYNEFIKDASTVKDWSSGHQNILKLTEDEFKPKPNKEYYISITKGKKLHLYIRKSVIDKTIEIKKALNSGTTPYTNLLAFVQSKNNNEALVARILSAVTNPRDTELSNQ